MNRSYLKSGSLYATVLVSVMVGNASGQEELAPPPIKGPDELSRPFAPSFRIETRTEFVERTNSETGRHEKVPVNRQVYVPIGEPQQMRSGASRTTSEVNSIKNQYMRTSDVKERETLKSRLLELVSAEFDEMHKRQADQIREMQERLKLVTDTHEKRTDNKDRIVQRRMEDLLGTPPELQWNVQNGNDFDQANRGPYIDSFVPNSVLHGPQNANTSSGGRIGIRPSIISNPIDDRVAESFARRDPAERNVFDVQRSLTTHRTELELAQQELAQTRETNEILKVEANVKRLQAMIKLDEKQLAWMRESQQRILDEEKHSLGSSTSRKSEDRVNANEKIQQAEKMIELIESFNDKSE